MRWVFVFSLLPLLLIGCKTVEQVDLKFTFYDIERDCIVKNPPDAKLKFYIAQKGGLGSKLILPQSYLSDLSTSHEVCISGTFLRHKKPPFSFCDGADAVYLWSATMHRLI